MTLPPIPDWMVHELAETRRARWLRKIRLEVTPLDTIPEPLRAVWTDAAQEDLEIVQEMLGVPLRSLREHAA